jgi:hypothetical protein
MDARFIMTYRRHRVRSLVLLAIPIAVPLPARALSGTAELTGASVVTARGCGHDRGTLATVLQLAEDGTWTAQSVEGPIFSGTSAPKGRSGRKLALTLDPVSEQTLVAETTNEVAMLCELPSGSVVVTESRPKVLKLTLDKKLARAKLLVRYALKGTADGRSGTASLRIAGKGPWTAP